jgi:hypothetical protein
MIVGVPAETQIEHLPNMSLYSATASASLLGIHTLRVICLFIYFCIYLHRMTEMITVAV